MFVFSYESEAALSHILAHVFTQCHKDASVEHVTCTVCRVTAIQESGAATVGQFSPRGMIIQVRLVPTLQTHKSQTSHHCGPVWVSLCR